VIIVINGPLGVGKTQTGWRIVESLPRAAFVDIDYIAAVTPFDHNSAKDREYAYESAAVVAAHHVRHGYVPVVVSWVFETPEQLVLLRERFVGLGELHPFRLSCSPALLEDRIRQRGNENIEREVARGRELHAVLERESSRADLGYHIDASARTIDDVASTILRHVGIR